MSLEIYLSTHVTALLDLLARFLVQTSLLCRGVVGGGGGGEGGDKGEVSARGTMGRGKRGSEASAI